MSSLIPSLADLSVDARPAIARKVPATLEVNGAEAACEEAWMPPEHAMPGNSQSLTLPIVARASEEPQMTDIDEDDTLVQNGATDRADEYPGAVRRVPEALTMSLIESPPSHCRSDATRNATLSSPVRSALRTLFYRLDLRYSSVRQAFLAFDKDRMGSLSRDNFADGLVSHGVLLPPSDFEIVWSAFDRANTGKIAYSSFCAAMAHRMNLVSG